MPNLPRDLEVVVVTLGTNIQSLRAQRQVGEASSRFATSLERLASGSRINRASDDAAGLAIASALNRDTRLYTTAKRNISDGISAISIVSQALESQSGIMQRMLELAEQSANGSYSYTQRKSLQKEYESLTNEYQRISDTTKFNGLSLLGSQSSSLAIQLGIGGDTTSAVSINLPTTGSANGVTSANLDISKNGVTNAFDEAILGQFLNNLKPAAAPESPTVENLTQYLSNSAQHISAVDSNGISQDIYAVISPISAIAVGNSSQVNIYYMLADSSGNLSIQTTQNNINLGNQNSHTFALTVGGNVSLTVDLTGLSIQYSDLSSYNTPAGTAAVPTALKFTGVESKTRSRAALDVINNKMNEVLRTRGQIGAIENRLRYASNLIDTQKENSSAAASRIQDADIAMEAANSVKANITQEVAVSILAQANLEPEISLNLINSSTVNIP